MDNRAIKAHDANRHPGPMRVMRVDAEFAGVIVAVAFVVLGLVGLPHRKDAKMENSGKCEL
jgi:hypothetical protein